MMNPHADPPSTLTVLDAVRWATPQFESRPFDAPRLNAERLLGHVLDRSRLDLYLEFDRPLTSGEIRKFARAVARRMQGTPLQYITGMTEFFSLPFIVTPEVLVPRPETEVLVEQAVRFLERSDHESRSARQLDLFRPACPPAIFDIGTGAGVIALTLARRFPGLVVYASDVSPEALSVARRNAGNLGVAERVTWLTGPYFQPLASCAFEGRFDLILSNPPYIPAGEIDRLPEEIRRFEPRLALDGGVDGLTCCRRIIEEAPDYLRPGGALMMEIGVDQADRVVQVFETQSCFQSVRIIQDYNHLDRVVSAVRAERSKRA